MGILLSRFRKKKTTIEILEDLDKKIKDIQQYGQTTEQTHKKIVGTLIIWSVALYIIAALVFYFYFFPAALVDRFIYITPLLLFPPLIFLIKRVVTWYYNRKISRNREKLSTMQTEKKKILDDVTETETYKKAKEILLKFAPDQLRMTPLSPQPTVKPTIAESPRRPSTPQAVVAPLPGATDLRRRALTVSSTPKATSGMSTSSGPAPIGFTPTITPARQSLLQGTASKSFNAATIGPRSPLPRPILPQHRSYLDRLVEYLVGDGPSNRYALICQICDSHNGMALKEEFEYFGFRCCYCNFWNPARKQKPSAPKLEQDLHTPPPSIDQSVKITEVDASSVSSSSASGHSETPPSPSIETSKDPDYIETPKSLPDHIFNVKTIHDPRKRRRTMYQIRDPDLHTTVFPDVTHNNYHPFATKRNALRSSTMKNTNIDGKNSEIELVEKPSEQSDDEKEPEMKDVKEEDLIQSEIDKKKIEKTAEKEILEDKEKDAADDNRQTEEMEVDESPKKGAI